MSLSLAFAEKQPMGHQGSCLNSSLSLVQTAKIAIPVGKSGSIQVFADRHGIFSRCLQEFSDFAQCHPYSFSKSIGEGIAELLLDLAVKVKFVTNFDQIPVRRRKTDELRNGLLILDRLFLALFDRGGVGSRL